MLVYAPKGYIGFKYLKKDISRNYFGIEHKYNYENPIIFGIQHKCQVRVETFQIIFSIIEWLTFAEWKLFSWSFGRDVNEYVKGRSIVSHCHAATASFNGTSTILQRILFRWYWFLQRTYEVDILKANLLSLYPSFANLLGSLSDTTMINAEHKFLRRCVF